ncbi:phosphate acyltransferase [Mycoplasmopsis bovis]|nr:phosphate acyltransferase [Mycoplasmopsis bovis]WHL49035.1 phosphate acyltransferase [Mycoplasmopsis bovis]
MRQLNLIRYIKAQKPIGEVQLDAAVNEGVRKSKYKGETFTGEANVLVFPDLGAGNIGYKIGSKIWWFWCYWPYYYWC